MNISVLLRLVPPARARGRLAGQAEVVETGETIVFSDPDEMLAFLRQVSAEGSDPWVEAAAEPPDAAST
jgi:hypothetical protein